MTDFLLLVLAGMIAVIMFIEGYSARLLHEHFKVQDVSIMNETIARAARRLAAIILADVQKNTATQNMAITFKASHPLILQNGQKLLTRYPEFTSAIGMTVHHAAEMILGEMAQLKLGSNVTLPHIVDGATNLAARTIPD